MRAHICGCHVLQISGITGPAAILHRFCLRARVYIYICPFIQFWSSQLDMPKKYVTRTKSNQCESGKIKNSIVVSDLDLYKKLSYADFVSWRGYIYISVLSFYPILVLAIGYVKQIQRQGQLYNSNDENCPAFISD